MENKEMINHEIEMIGSLAIAIQKAGGDVSMILNRLCNLTAYELIGELSTNNIRFIYVGKTK